jgi:DNA-binding MarR family transcriptional regulator
VSETTSTDAPARDDLGWALGALLRSYRDLLSPVLGDFPHGQRGYQTLCEVVRGEQPSQLALANRLGIDRTVMTYLIDDLVDAGLLERRANPADRRQRQIVATPRGRKAVATLCSRVADAEGSVLGALDAEEHEQFRRLLDKAADATGPVEHTDDACAAVEEALDEARDDGSKAP